VAIVSKLKVRANVDFWILSMENSHLIGEK